MKKLMIAAAIVCAAVVSQAATTKWATGDVYWDGVGSQLADDTGDYDFTGNAYLFWLTEAQYNSIKSGDAATLWNNFKAGATSSTLNFGSLGQATFKAQGEFDEGVVSFGTFGGEAGNYYAAVIATHEDDGGEIDAYSANTMYAIATPTAMTGASTVALGWGEKAGGTATTWQKIESVPEPFSGTLAILGMGAIALRRKMKKAKK